jgi:protein-S-isoprenylcysteine O-methyltransferase Ste14
MSNPVSSQPGQKPSLERSGIRRIVQVLVSILLIGVLLFLSAGRLDWLWGWLFLAGWLLLMLPSAVVMSRFPDLINERGRRAENIKGWDKVLMGIYSLLLFATPVVAGLDAVRFGWSAMPLALHVIGVVLSIPAMIMPLWAMSANAYLSTMVRIQDDRGQQVVTTGPYRYVRHPMYVGTVFFGLCIPLFLGSWWAFIPCGLIVVIFIIRTALEDRTLREELPGYAEYAQRVRYRLLPGIW